MLTALVVLGSVLLILLMQGFWRIFGDTIADGRILFRSLPVFVIGITLLIAGSISAVTTEYSGLAIVPLLGSLGCLSLLGLDS